MGLQQGKKINNRKRISCGKYDLKYRYPGFKVRGILIVYYCQEASTYFKGRLLILHKGKIIFPFALSPIPSRIILSSDIVFNQFSMEWFQTLLYIEGSEIDRIIIK
jgi:hypothetical protein